MVIPLTTKGGMPRLGLGMAALGRPGYINMDRSEILGRERTIDMMQSQANAVMDELFRLSESSCPWLDCARSYGLSEKFVGEYLRSRGVSPNDVYLSSKWGYTYVADWNIELGKGEPHEVKDHTVENFLKQVEETDDLVGEFVRLYQVHSATFESGILTDSRVHEALSECRTKRGWAIGLSVSGPKQADVLMEAMRVKTAAATIDDDEDSPRRGLFDSVQCTFNVLEQRPGPALKEAYDSGMDIIIKEGLANGRALRHPSLKKYADRMGCQPDQLALACILAQPFEPRVLSGAITKDQLESNLQAIDVASKLEDDPKLLEEIMESCVMNSEDYWSERSALAWN